MRNIDWGFLLGLTVIIAGVLGWILNIVALVGANEIAGMEIARIAGIFIPPLGAVLGYL